ncbi:MAG: SPOR domain-containing protein [Flavobacteriales bacterium]|nr:SPOR domain-containing protein [Flavobacteriales bacterium]
MKNVIILVMSLCLIQSSAQEDSESDWRLYKSKDAGTTAEARVRLDKDVPLRQKGEVRYIQTERISVFDDYLRINPVKQDGYRIQLVFGSRSEVSSARSKFLSRWNYSDYETYLPPNFRLRVGDFVNRWQAERALRELKVGFPNSYIVRDKIEIPKEFR